ncbi:LysR family transcriptional regulator [Budvicia aquatica]|uniref:LysR family transcriptional regulator n=1 Tax=Budvicia aquatica TaxID=82979 RepID=UPI002085BDD6|nr:LysR family transcriptional regulator [Budvicia aquatica]GKX51909.1 hypothetical protein SOASR029_22180 [Budvicia aquatica]
MNLVSLKTFLTIVRVGNIKKSSEELFVAQSTVTKRLQVLENEIGFELFERSKGVRKISLTDSGKLFLEIAQRWYEFFLEVEDIKSNKSKVNISIGCLNSINFSIFPELYKKIINDMSNINLKIVTTHSVDIFSLIEKRAIDVGFSFSDLKSQNTMSFKLYSEPMVGLCLSTSLLSNKENVELASLDVDNEFYVRWDEDFEDWHLKNFGRIHGFNAQFDNGHLMMSLLLNSTDWAILPSSAALYAKLQHDCSSFTLAEKIQPKDRVVYMVMHKNQKESTVKAIKALILLLDNLSTQLIEQMPNLKFYTRDIINSGLLS